MNKADTIPNLKGMTCGNCGEDFKRKKGQTGKNLFYDAIYHKCKK